VESWHRSLKENYLANLRDQRVDVLVYILYDMAIPDFMIDHVRTVNLFQSGVLSRAEKIRKRLAYNIDGKKEELGGPSMHITRIPFFLQKWMLPA
jgi:hypothetical protein